MGEMDWAIKLIPTVGLPAAIWIFTVYLLERRYRTQDEQAQLQNDRYAKLAEQNIINDQKALVVMGELTAMIREQNDRLRQTLDALLRMVRMDAEREPDRERDSRHSREK